MAWEVSVWKSAPNERWEKMATLTDHVPFSVRDRSGAALVHSRLLEGLAGVDEEVLYPSVRDVPEHVRAFLRAHRVWMPVDVALTLKESALEVGETAVVVGHARRTVNVQQDGGSYRQVPVTTQVTITAPRYAAVLFSDVADVVAD